MGYLSCHVALVSLVCGMLVIKSVSTPPSRFVKNIDTDAIEKKWQEGDIDDEEWHEDTFEWKRKMQEKIPGMTIEEIVASMKNGKKDAYLEGEARKKDMQMAFCTLHPDATANKAESEKLGAKWQAILQTGGNRVNVYATSDHELLFTEEYGRILEVRDFLLAQPEVAKFRWKDTDFTKESLAASAAASAPEPKAAKKKAGGSKSKKTAAGKSDL